VLLCARIAMYDVRRLCEGGYVIAGCAHRA